MNREQYLNELERCLRDKKIADVEEIVEEYRQHFIFKDNDGYGEEEVAAALESPDRIAEQYAGAGSAALRPSGFVRAVTVTGLAFLDLVLILCAVVLFAWVLVMAVFAVTCLVLGGCLILNQNIAGLIPPMPYFAALILGVSMLGLAVLSAVGTILCWAHIRRWVQVFCRWQKNLLGGRAQAPMSLRPEIGRKSLFLLSRTAIISLTVFGAFFLAACLALTIHTGFKPFWHELGWFV